MAEEMSWKDRQSEMTGLGERKANNPDDEKKSGEVREGRQTRAALEAAMLGMAAANPSGGLGMGMGVADLSAAEKKLEAESAPDAEPVRVKPPEAPRAHRDPITGESGAHPVGVGVGAATAGVAAAAVTGMTIGSVTGPIGMAVGTALGAAVGAIAGGLAGKEVAEAVHPTAEDAYWRAAYAGRPYVRAGERYDDYRAAYEYGWATRARHAGKSWDEAEPHLQSEWETATAQRRRSWLEVRAAVKDA